METGRNYGVIRNSKEVSAMKVSFVQSGGFLGLVKGCELDTAVLTPDTAQELEQIAKASGISTSGEFFSDSGRDLQQYEITIEDGNSTISVIFDDETIPASAKSLVGYLKKHSQPKPLD
jgi:hypothetical protein